MVEVRQKRRGAQCYGGSAGAEQVYLDTGMESSRAATNSREGSLEKVHGMAVALLARGTAGRGGATRHSRRVT